MTLGDRALQGEMGSVATVARNLERLDGLNNAMNWLRLGIGHVQSGGNSQSLTRLVAVCRPAETNAQQIARVRLRAGQALQQYADQVAFLQNEVRQLQARKASAQTERSADERRLSAITDDASDSAWLSNRLSDRIGDANESLRHIDQSLAKHDQARIDADDRCAATFRACVTDLKGLTQTAENGDHSQPGFSTLLERFITGIGAGAGKKSGKDGVRLPKLYTFEELLKRGHDFHLSKEEIRALPPKELVSIANKDGLPAWARDVASRELVKYALKNPDGAYSLLGFTDTGLSLEDFTKQVKALDVARRASEKTAVNMPGPPTVQLIGFGNHDGALTSSISLGDLDKASNVGINVSGMDSDVEGIGNGAMGAESIFRAAVDEDAYATYAVVTWIGYNSPGGTEVFDMDRANSGAVNLANFIDGLNAARTGNPIEQFAVLGHSYGSTTAVEALKITNSPTDIDSLITYGSAGVADGTSVDEINAKNVFATKAEGDEIAGKGIFWGKRIDPTKIDGVVEFSAEGSQDENGANEKKVTMHDMYSEDSTGDFLNPGGRVGYLSIGTSSVNDIGKILATGGLE